MTNEINIKNEHAATSSKSALYLKVPNKRVRVGRREGAEAIARDGDDDLLLGQFSNTTDSNLYW
ncbi:hypothetical protein [Polynucleobacter ibericus]|uniref:hypothetical protein n=1 Tax=Polynucleobacter ibericus TaxID=1819725 RepID=UPI001BFE0E04|nr:hypothetical protein [Polynucleobacter ibericus]QWE07946.1 hypothetical protein AOC20_05780 [Polynucleobacter ibericus]